MICYVCDANNWHTMGTFSKEGELLVCKTCGNACYRIDVAEQKKLLDFYRTSYRAAPNHMNLLTTTNKLGYVKAFLSEFLAEAQASGKKMITGDVGCATGYLPAFFRKLGHRATGSEYTVTFRRFAEHFYGIPVTEELEPKHKYDLITLYHVLEHMTEPDKKLAQYRDMLAEGGRIMVATPEWLNVLEEASGTAMESFEHLFPKPHINIFTRQSLQNLFAKAGLEIVKADYEQYGQTYLLKRADVQVTMGKMTYEPWQKIVEKLVRTKEAIQLFKAGKYDDAKKLWPKFPEAWLALIGNVYGKSPDKQQELFEEVRPLLGSNTRVVTSLALWFYQNARYEDSIVMWEQLQQTKPNADGYVFMGWCYAQLKQHKKAMQCFANAMDLNPTKWVECSDFVCQQACEMPTWDEKMASDLKEKWWAQTQAKLGARPIDPIMFPEQGQDAPKPLQDAPGEAGIVAATQGAALVHEPAMELPEPVPTPE